MKTQIIQETHPLFSIVSATDKARLLEQTRVTHILKGNPIFSEGEIPASWYLLQAGYVKLTKTLPNGNLLLLRILRPGDPLAELPASSSLPFPANATALTDCQVIFVPLALYIELKGRYPVIATTSLQTITERTTTLQARMGEFALPSIEARLAAFFLRLLEYADNPEKNSRIPIPLSRADLASAANTRTETAIRVMRDWEKSGLLVTEKTGFIVSSRDELKKRLEA